MPDARTEVTGALWADRIAVIGGFLASGAASPRVDVYEPATNRWTQGPPLPVSLHHAGAATVAGRLYVVGGYTLSGDGAWKAVADVYSLGRTESQWRREPPLSSARGALGVAAAGTTLVAFGGVGDVGGPARTVETFDVASGATTWSPGPDLLEPREHVAAAASGNRVYAIAGRQGSLASNLRTVESWEVGAAAWRPEPMVTKERGGTAASVTAKGTVCVAGGEEDAGTIAPVECLGAGGWRTVANLRVPRHGLAVVAEGETLHVIAGGPKPGLFVSDAHEVVKV